ncbi:hypothetical protein K402DRAFT_383518 [Aulographum hederae CBS 113979]|uniref:EthD domain-containing protein n=1 Tax=Aulographum hederae CBS 113979 TaxID=1176131 RepID=A0A6G1GQN7_9PEZI|nr:hypothetical protein K402DRAFT_383518 [Aulographum hederae CBS 113979]
MSYLLLAYSTPTHPSLSDSDFNTWYTTHHITDVLSSSLADLAIRYKSLDQDARYRYLAAYRVADPTFMADAEKMARIPDAHEMLPGKEEGTGGGRWADVADAKVLLYERVQTFEGEGGSGKGQGLAVVGFDPADGQDDDFDHWYRNEHLGKLSKCTGYLRTTRYKLLPGPDGKLDGVPYIAMHEYETTNFPEEQIKETVGTEWSKKHIQGAKKFERGLWEYIVDAGKTDEKF